MESVEREKVPTDPFAMESDVNVVLDAIFLVFVSFFLMLLGLDTNTEWARTGPGSAKADPGFQVSIYLILQSSILIFIRCFHQQARLVLEEY